MGIRIERLSRQQLIFYSMIVMLIALFTSRFLLTVGFILFLFVTCFHKIFFQQFISLFKNPFLLGISFLFFIPFITWFWTEDKSMWIHFVRIKLPLLLFPIAFAGNWQLSEKQWKWIASFFLVLMFVGCCWSLWQYIQNMHHIHRVYLKAKLFSTPLENDHVRFSLIVSVAVVCSVILFRQCISKNKRVLLILLCLFFIVYLHVLSARTGLIAFYLFLLLCIFYFLFQRKKLKWVIGLSVAFLALPLLAWLLLPTFQNRIKYNLYDLSNVQQNKYIHGANDGNRILSLKAGWNILQQHPFGTGGDVVNKTYEWYDKNISAMQQSDKLFPSSEPLMYAGFAGWIGFVLFFVIMALPFFQQVKTNYFSWVVLNLIMAFSFLFDIELEVQFGVFIYAFIVLWWWKWFNTLPRQQHTSL